jgi:hypothetical protein
MAEDNLITFQCTACKEIKPLNDFYARKDSLRGHHSQCKDCQDHFEKFPEDRPRQVPVVPPKGQPCHWEAIDLVSLDNLKQLAGELIKDTMEGKIPISVIDPICKLMKMINELSGTGSLEKQTKALAQKIRELKATKGNPVSSD